MLQDRKINLIKTTIMEVKKSSKADLEGRKTLFLEIGLCASLLMMIGAFAWGQGKREAPAPPPADEEFVETEIVEQTVQEVPVMQIPTPAQVLSVLSDHIEIVTNDKQVATNDVFADFSMDNSAVAHVTSAVEIKGTEGMPDFFENVAFMPKFNGQDYNAFIPWIMTRIRYPEMALQMGTQGTVMVRFIVRPDGSLTDIEVTSNTDRSLNAEALRVVKQSPKWTPGRQITEPVPVRIEVPVEFKLQ